MKSSKSIRKLAITIVLTILMSTAALSVMPATTVKAQEGAHGGPPISNIAGVPGPLQAGVTPSVYRVTEASLSFRPNPVGVGQTILVNIWIVPSIHNQRCMQGYTVTITKPDGTKDVIGPMASYQGDATAWFEYTVTQIGTWKLKFDFAGDYFPAGNYSNGQLVTAITNPTNNTASAGGGAGTNLGAVYYEPSSTQEQTLTVQQEPVLPWPAVPLPTDYWTRPASLDNREWWPILGNYPGTGYQGIWGGSTWNQLYPNTNPYYAPGYNFHPWVQGPNTSHIVWTMQQDIAGLLGGPAQEYGITGSNGNPSVVYDGRAYQTYTKQGVGTVAGCYDIRTGQIYYEIPTAQGGITPSYVVYYPPVASTTILGEEAQFSYTVDLVTITGGRLIKINPYSGLVTTNVSIAPLTGTSGVFYNQMGGYSMEVQTLNATAGKFALINWTTAGTSTTFATRILSNTTYSGDGRDTFFAAGVVNDTDRFNGGVQIDFNAGVWCQVDALEWLNTTGTYEQMVISAYSIQTGVRLWRTNVNVGTDYSAGPYSRSDYITDHGKIAVNTYWGVWQAYDLQTGNLVWTTSPRGDYPWASHSFGAYATCSAYGMFYKFAYDGVYAYNWTDGKQVWHYQAPALSEYETPYIDNGVVQMSFNAGGEVADGKMYIYNTEHTPSWPLTRGWQLHCINVTNGEGVWKIAGGMVQGAIADGYLTAADQQDGSLYCFGKGKSATAVSAPQTSVTQGVPVLIQGSVLDESPAQAGTPCVSKDSMSTEMEYLHMQRPIDGIWHNITMAGVPVTLTATDSSGATTTIGTATTNAYQGTFSLSWTPPKADTYSILAYFAGDDSYGTSSAGTGLLVTPAPTATATPTPTPTPAVVGTVTSSEVMMYVLVAAIAIIIAIAVATFVMIRNGKRQ